MSDVSMQVVIIFTAIGYKPPVVLGRPAPDWGAAIGWIIVAACVTFIPGVFIYQFIRRGGRKVSHWNSNTPNVRVCSLANLIDATKRC